MTALSPAYQDAAFTLFGVTDEAAELGLGERQRDAGETAGLPKPQRPSTVRGPGGLQEYLVTRLAAYFEDGPEIPLSDVTRGRGYFVLRYAVALIERRADPVWDLSTELTVEAYRSDVDLVVTGSARTPRRSRGCASAVGRPSQDRGATGDQRRRRADPGRHWRRSAVAGRHPGRDRRD